MCSFSLINFNISISGHRILKPFSVTSQRKQSRKSTEQNQHVGLVLRFSRKLYRLNLLLMDS
ncbi:hypothetical protein E2C01_076623 [Portunus trituberculatus]|uniref:Uncharacterized protein n=1 Tax=Portunus trituberculatus TaxID=210409 RepID=A0A5B7I958_PORTR|nr:hypothetical protein [Portunus trituberculatus]